MIELSIQTPTANIYAGQVLSVDFEAVDGHFTLLPRHADFVSVVTVGIIAVVDKNEKQLFIASNSGILVKQGKKVAISVRNAVLNDDIHALTTIIEHDFRKFNEERKETNAAMARLEMGLTRGFMKVKEEAV